MRWTFLVIALLFSVAGGCSAAAQPGIASSFISGEESSLLAKSKALTSQERAEAQQLFSTGFDLWQAGDFAAAEIAFARGVTIDPANAAGNFYYGDSLRRRGSIDADIYLKRAILFGGNSAEAIRAEAALKQPKVLQSLSEMSAEQRKAALVGTWRLEVPGESWTYMPATVTIKDVFGSTLSVEGIRPGLTGRMKFLQGSLSGDSVILVAAAGAQRTFTSQMTQQGRLEGTVLQNGRASNFVGTKVD